MVYGMDSKTIKAAMKAAFIFVITKLTFITQRLLGNDPNARNDLLGSAALTFEPQVEHHERSEEETNPQTRLQWMCTKGCRLVSNGCTAVGQ